MAAGDSAPGQGANNDDELTALDAAVTMAATQVRIAEAELNAFVDAEEGEHTTACSNYEAAKEAKLKHEHECAVSLRFSSLALSSRYALM